MSTSDMLLFATLIEVGSISGAARQLGISKSGASRRLSALEERLGVKLLFRSSRAVRPTESGTVYYRGCRRVLADIERTESEISNLSDGLVGRLRVHGPQFLGSTWLSPALVAFLQRHPTVQGDVVLNDDYSNMIGDRVDVAIRVSPLPDSSLVVRKLAPVERVLCASPVYLHRIGGVSPSTDLEDLDWILYSHRLEGDNRLHMHIEDIEVSVRMKGRLRTNSASTVRSALIAGLGVAMVPAFVVADALQDGRLERVLPEATLDAMWLAAVYPHTRQVSAKVKSFVDFLQQEWPPPDGFATGNWLGRAPRSTLEGQAVHEVDTV